MRFRTALILILVSILLATVAIVGFLSYRNSEFAVRELSSQVLEQTSQRIDQRVDSVLSVAVAQSKVYEELLDSGSVDINDYLAMTRHFLGSIRANPQLSYLSFATERGEYWHVFHRADGAIEVRYFLREDDHMVLTDSAPKPDGTLEVLRHDDDSDRADPRDRPYYTWAKKAGEPTWTETYLFLGMESIPTIPGVTRATPIYRDGELAGVLTADFDLQALSKFVATLPVGKNGFAFIVELRRPTDEHPEGERRVIAHPDPDLLIAPADPDDPSKGADAVPGDEIADPRVRAFLAELPDDVSDAPTETFRPVELDVDGERYIGGYRRVGEEDLAWIICMMMPEDDVMGSVYANTRTTVYIVVLGIVVAIIVSFLLSAAIGRTLRELAAESQAIGEFELEGRDPKPSRLVEIRQLGTALEEMKASLRSFKKFVPAELVRALLASGEEATLGGERREISIFFCDIAGFTSIAESMPADQLVELLGEFLGTMSRQIMESDGTVDKYIGDAIMAFWGAPKVVDDPAMIACATALACQRELVALNAAWQTKHDWPTIEMRIGLHVGEAVVGNFGSDDRLDYTAIGDSVNLSSRIEGLNKYYGTNIAMSEQTYEAVKDEVVARPLDRVSVKGRAGGVVVYELLGLRAEVSAEAIARAERHAEAMEAYFTGDWSTAERLFDELVESASGDVAARVLLERVRTLAADPPETWDGIHRMSSK